MGSSQLELLLAPTQIAHDVRVCWILAWAQHKFTHCLLSHMRWRMKVSLCTRIVHASGNLTGKGEMTSSLARACKSGSSREQINDPFRQIDAQRDAIKAPLAIVYASMKEGAAWGLERERTYL